jgi:hypothetical protein
VNFFQSSMKLVSKERVGGKVKKCYDAAKTPYQRVLDSPRVADEVKAALRQQYLTLNPVALLRQMHRGQESAWLPRRPDQDGSDLARDCHGEHER